MAEVQTQTQIQHIYQPSEKDLETRKWAYENFRIMWNNSNKSYRQFNDKTYFKYLEDNRKMFNLWARPRVDGRSNIKTVAPLNKLMAILARVATKRPEIKVTATIENNIVDEERGQVIQGLHKWSEDSIDRDDTADTEYFFEAFDCESDGLVIVYKGIDNQTHKRKIITEYDPNTGIVVFDEEEFKTNRGFSQTISPEDFFVWSFYIRDVQRQPLTAWRTLYEKEHFLYEFKNFGNHKFVLQRSAVRDELSQTYYRDKWHERIKDDRIEVLRVFDRFNDRMVIVANGVVLQDTPMPWNNGKPKKYPFAKTISAPFTGGEFWAGMSLAFKLQGDVDAIDALYNMGIEQVKLAINPPYVTSAENEMEDHMLLPGRKIKVDDITQFRELQFKSPDQSYFSFINEIGKNIDLASVDPVAQGQAQPNVTARGQVIAEENARQMLSQFNMMMENLVLQKAKLAIPNIIQFQLLPGAEFRVEDVVVGNEIGIQEIVVKNNRQEFETPDEIQAIEDIAEFQGINLERMNITPNFLLNVDYHLKVIMESSFKRSKSLAIADNTQKIAGVQAMFPEIFQGAQEIFFKDFMRAYDDNPNKYLEASQGNQTTNLLQGVQQLQGQKQLQGQNNLPPQLSGVE